MMRYCIFIVFFLTTAIAEEVSFTKEMEIAVEKRVKEKLESLVKRIKKNSVAELTHEILEREEILKTEEVKLKKNKIEFENSLKDFEKKINDFESRQGRFISCVDKVNKNKDERIKKMVDIISGMKPVKAADIISVQDQEIAIQILSRLDNAKASKIFNLLTKEKSALLQKMYLNMKK